MRLKLKLYRTKVNMSQVKLASKLSVTETYISRMERELSIPSADLFEKMSSILEVCPYNLIDFCVDCNNKDKCSFDIDEFCNPMTLQHHGILDADVKEEVKKKLLEIEQETKVKQSVASVVNMLVRKWLEENTSE